MNHCSIVLASYRFLDFYSVCFCFFNFYCCLDLLNSVVKFQLADLLATTWRYLCCLICRHCSRHQTLSIQVDTYHLIHPHIYYIWSVSFLFLGGASTFQSTLNSHFTCKDMPLARLSRQHRPRPTDRTIAAAFSVCPANCLPCTSSLQTTEGALS
jgi:hypothetical protein